MTWYNKLNCSIILYGSAIAGNNIDDGFTVCMTGLRTHLFFCDCIIYIFTLMLFIVNDISFLFLELVICQGIESFSFSIKLELVFWILGDDIVFCVGMCGCVCVWS